jgi:hypothetical protein
MIKCPSCEAIFALPEGDPRPAPRVYPEQEPARYPARRHEDDDLDAAAFSTDPRVRYPEQRHGDDYDRGEDGRDEAFPDRPKHPRGRGQTRGHGLLIGLCSGGFILLLGLFAIGAWVWPGFLKSNAPIQGEGSDELLAFLPADYNIFFGMDFKVLRARPEWDQRMDKAIRNYFALFPQVPKVVEETVRDADQVLAAGKIPPDSDWQRFTGMIILKTKNPYSATKIAQALPGSPARTLNGKVYHEISLVQMMGLPAFGPGGPGPGGPAPGVPGTPAAYLCLVTERILVFAYVPPDQLGTVLTAHGSPPKLSADTRALIRGLDKSLNWLLVLGAGI